MEPNFSELTFLSQVKARPGLYFGNPSLQGLLHMVGGMQMAFGMCGAGEQFRYLNNYIAWYHGEVIKDRNGYACWWNHLTYVSGGDDREAFHAFFRSFERFLLEKYGLTL